jgi:hypothetical protein
MQSILGNIFPPFFVVRRHFLVEGGAQGAYDLPAERGAGAASAAVAESADAGIWEDQEVLEGDLNMPVDIGPVGAGCE